MSRHPAVCVLLAVAIVCASSVGRAEQAATLPLGKAAAGEATNDASAVYRFVASTAGVLTVTVQGTGDLALRVADEDNQTVPDGSTDGDRAGSAGTELLTVTLTEPGTYQVHVRQQDRGAAKFQIGASWIPFPGFAQPPDADRRPAGARALDVGKSWEDSVDASTGDRVDWYALTPKTAGTLTVVLRAIADSKVDLTLEVYLGGDMAKAAGQSDQDLQGAGANESVTVDVPAGQRVLVRVTANGSGESGKYRLAASLIQ